MKRIMPLEIGDICNLKFGMSGLLSAPIHAGEMTGFLDQESGNTRGRYHSVRLEG
jgi:hypothetical protein